MEKRIVFSSDRVIKRGNGKHYVVYNNKVVSNYNKVYEAQDKLQAIGREVLKAGHEASYTF